MSEDGQQRPQYTTHPTVVAAATVVGAVACISIVLWILLLVIAPVAYEDGAILLVIGSIILGLVLWAMIKSIVSSDMEDHNNKTKE